MTATAALKWEIGEAGTSESPPGSNHVKYWDLYAAITGGVAWQGSPWCGAFAICGIEHSNQWHAPANWIGVYAIQSWGEAHGRFKRGSAGVKPGDILIIGGPGVHTGLARSAARADGSVLSCEGNTSPGSEGSQFNGGTVALKLRTAGEIYGYVRIHDLLGGGKAPSKKAIDSRPAEPQYRRESKSGALHLWEFGPRIEALQELLGVPSDGYYGRATAKAVKAFKAKHAGYGSDGSTAGTKFIGLVRRHGEARQVYKVLRQGDKGGMVRKLQRKLVHHGFQLRDDGDFGPKTARALKAFKKKRGMKVDAVATQRVWRALEK